MIRAMIYRKPCGRVMFTVSLLFAAGLSACDESTTRRRDDDLLPDATRDGQSDARVASPPPVSDARSPDLGFDAMPAPLDATTADSALTCVLAYEACFTALPGSWRDPDSCYGGSNEYVPTGCGTNDPPLRGMIVGADYCGGMWVAPQDDEGRYSVDPVELDEGSNRRPLPLAFTLRLDGEPAVHCTLTDLPTALSRMVMECVDGQGQSTSMLLESDNGACADCADVSGCYEWRDIDEACPSNEPCFGVNRLLQIESTPDCRVEVSTATAEPRPGLGPGWVSREGVVTLSFGEGTTPVCSLMPDGRGNFARSVCTVDGADHDHEMVYGAVLLARMDDSDCFWTH